MSEQAVRPGQQGIEITDSMIEAGTKVLHKSGLLDYHSSIDDMVVEEIIGAALSCETTR